MLILFSTLSWGCASKYEHKEQGKDLESSTSIQKSLSQVQKRRVEIFKKDPTLRLSSKFLKTQALIASKVYESKQKKWLGESDSGYLMMTPWAPKKKSIRDRLRALVKKENFARKNIFAIHRKQARMNKEAYKGFKTFYFEEQRAGSPSAPYNIKGSWTR